MMIMRYILLSICLLMLSASALAAGNISLTPVKGTPLASEFRLPDIDGNIHQLSHYRGKVLIVNFWATWCPPCRDEMPSMEQAFQKIKNSNIVMLAVNVGEDADTIFTFTADYDVSFPLLMDKDSTIIKQWPVVALPTSYIVDPQGHLVYRAVGGRDWHDEQMINKLKALLKPGHDK